MTERTEEIDGWKVRLSRTGNGDYPKFHAEAKDDLWGKYGEAFAETADDALRRLAHQTEIDVDELLITFGMRI